MGGLCHGWLLKNIEKVFERDFVLDQDPLNLLQKRHDVEDGSGNNPGV